MAWTRDKTWTTYASRRWRSNLAWVQAANVSKKWEHGMKIKFCHLFVNFFKGLNYNLNCYVHNVNYCLHCYIYFPWPISLTLKISIEKSINLDSSILYATLVYIFGKILTIRNSTKGLAWIQMVISEDGIVFSQLYVVRFALRGAIARWVVMRDVARECQARCINRSDTFDFSFLYSHYSGARARAIGTKWITSSWRSFASQNSKSFIKMSVMYQQWRIHWRFKRIVWPAGVYSG